MITDTPIGLDYVKSVSAHNDFPNLTVDLRLFEVKHDSQANAEPLAIPTTSN